MKFAKTNKLRSRRQSSFALVHLDALTTNSPGEEGKMPPSTPKVVKKEKYAWQKLCEAIHSGDDFQGTNEESHRLEEVFMFVCLFVFFFFFRLSIFFHFQFFVSPFCGKITSCAIPSVSKVSQSQAQSQMKFRTFSITRSLSAKI